MKKNILVLYLGRKGGGAVYSYEMTKGLIENGYNIHLVIASGVENYNKWKKLNVKTFCEIDTYHDKISFIKNTIMFLYFKKYKIISFLKCIKIDVIYIPMTAFWTGIITKAIKEIPVVITVHDIERHLGEKNTFIDFFSRKEIESAKKIVILSKVFLKDAVEIYKKNEKDIYYIPHGIFSYYKEIFKGCFDSYYESYDVNFLFFGRISKYKGLDILASTTLLKYY